ncbi:MAG: hypothetical protein M1570_06600 [Chloroflexi bacterium]|nr:hypothetical protein [Chloroflexota bacterium]
MKWSRFALSQRMTIASGILCLVAVVVVLQLWLFTATMEAYLGGNNSVALPALVASIVCLLLNVGLFHYFRNLDR